MVKMVEMAMMEAVVKEANTVEEDFPVETVENMEVKVEKMAMVVKMGLVAVNSEEVVIVKI